MNNPLRPIGPDPVATALRDVVRLARAESSADASATLHAHGEAVLRRAHARVQRAHAAAPTPVATRAAELLTAALHSEALR